MSVVISVLQFSAALLLILTTVYISYTLAWILLPRSTVPVRWSGSTVLGMWVVSVLFHLLLPLGQFKLPVALVALGLVGLVCWSLGNPLSLFLQRLGKDLRWLTRIWRTVQGTAYRWLIYVFGLFVLLKAARVLLLPPLGWDTLTYHAVKAGLWVQTGGPIALDAPGGWSFYRHYFGGGEIFTAWAMLPFHGDPLVTSVDVLQWLLCGLVLYALGRQLRIPVKWAGLGSIYILSLPGFHLLIGSGYVEPAFNLALLASLLFFVRAVQTNQGQCLLLSLLAAGLAMGIKITALPAVGLLGIGSLWLWHRAGSEGLGRWLLGGCLAALAVMAPWMIYNIAETGYPLGPIPLQLAGVPLGLSNPSLDWYQQILTLPPYEFASEIQSLKWLFRAPTGISLHLSALTLAPLLLAIPGLLAWLRRDLWVGLALLGFMVSILAYFYSPGFSVVRLMFAGFNGRFLIPFVAIPVLVSLGSYNRKGWFSRLFSLFLWSGVLIHIFSSGFYGWARFEQIQVPLVLVVALFLVYGFSHLPLSRPGLVMATLILTLLLGPLLEAYKGDIRYRAAAESSVSHPTVKYWARPAALVDETGTRHRIAVTAGPRQAADNWAMYLFMGRWLQNQIVYVPVSQAGEIVDYWPLGQREKAARFGPWMDRLHSLGITHVMSFHPASLEMGWMDLRADIFQRLDGAPGVWGFYRLKP